MSQLTAAHPTLDSASIEALANDVSRLESLVDFGSEMLENPVTGERFVIRETAAETNGELFAFDFYLAAGGAVPAPHVHPSQEETFVITDGTMGFRYGLKKIIAEPGDVVVVPAGKPHAFWNAGDEEAALRVEVRPALKMEEMFRTLCALAEGGRLNARGIPKNPVDLAMLALTYQDEFSAPYIPAVAQRALLAPLAWAGRKKSLHVRAGLALAQA